MSKINISVVSYLNSRPFLLGLKSVPFKAEVNISADIPSKIASKLINNKTDVGLIPVGGLLDLPDYHVVSKYCIGAEHDVRTVVVASQVPLNEIETILLDYQSRSSVLLARVLAKNYWKRNIKWENTCANFEKKSITGSKAAVVIGDRVFSVEKRYPYIYDLSTEWKKFTGLPFVFAVWASFHKLDNEFVENFEEALTYGLNHIDEVSKMEEKNYPGINIFEYFTKNISFGLDDRKKEGMKLFLQLAKELEPI